MEGVEERGVGSQRKERMVDFVRGFLEDLGGSSSWPCSRQLGWRRGALRGERRVSVWRVSVGISGQGEPWV
jgi:hypothetical protein